MPRKARQSRPKLVEQEASIQIAVQALKKREVHLFVELQLFLVCLKQHSTIA
jgi:hypothetical protein